MTIGPERMLSAWCSSFIKQTLLCNQRKRTLGNFSARNAAFRRCDFINAAAEMNRARPTARFCCPRNWFTQRIIDFENAGRVSKRSQAPAIFRRQLLTGDSQKFPNRNVQKNSSRFGQLLQSLYPTVDLNAAAEFAQIIRESICNLLRAAPWNRPADGVSREAQDQGECRRYRRFQSKK